MHKAVSRDDSATLVIGPSGAGKSLFTTGLAERGWRYLSDDVLPIRIGDGRVLPFPLAPSVRLPGEPQVPAHRLQNVERSHVGLAANRLETRPLAVSAILLPIFDLHEKARTAHMPPVEVARALIENCLNLDRHTQRGVAFLCALANRVPAVGLRYADRGIALGIAANAFGAKPKPDAVAGALPTGARV